MGLAEGISSAEARSGWSSTDPQGKEGGQGARLNSALHHSDQEQNCTSWQQKGRTEQTPLKSTNLSKPNLSELTQQTPLEARSGRGPIPHYRGQKQAETSGDTERNPSKFPSSPKHTDPSERDLKAAMKNEIEAMMKEMKETLATEYKKSMEEQTSQIKELSKHMRDSIQRELQDLKDSITSHTGRITQLEKHIEELKGKLQTKKQPRNQQGNKRQSTGRKSPVSNEQGQKK